MIFILELLKNFMVEINKTTSTDRFHETDGVFILQQLHSTIVVKQGILRESCTWSFQSYLKNFKIQIY